MRLSFPIRVCAFDQPPDHVRAVRKVWLAFPQVVYLFEQLIGRDHLHALFRGCWLFHGTTIHINHDRINTSLLTTMTIIGRLIEMR